jgi:hypothetical protein
LDLGGDWAFAASRGIEVRAGVRVANVLDLRYETSGFMSYDASGAEVPLRIPAAERNVIAQLRLTFR